MRRHALIAATAAIAGRVLVASWPAGAATDEAKPKPLKVLKGAYTATAVPDPTMEGTGEAGMQCFNVNPESVDNHPLSLPGRGMLKIVLDSPDPAKNKLDWDLYLLDAKGNVLSGSDGTSAHE